MMNEAKHEAKHEAKQTTDFLPYTVPAIVWDGESRYEVSPFLVFKNIPIGLLAEFKSEYKGCGFTIRWRGPRKHRKDRSRWLRQSVCTREDAVSFSVYCYK